MPKRSDIKKVLVIGVIGADVHAVGNKILYHAFTEAGFDVVNLGVMVSQEEYIAAAIEADAKIALEEARVESARQVAARQIGDLYGQLESCLQLLAQIRETHKPINPLPEAPAPEKAEPEKPAPQKTIPPLKNDPSADMFANLQFGRNYDTGKKR